MLTTAGRQLTARWRCDVAGEGATRTVANVDDQGRIVVERDAFRATWSDGTKLNDAAVEKMHDGWRLAVRGTREDGNCHSLFVPVDFTRDGALKLSDEGEGEGERLTESCSGAPCSRCKLSAFGGGCTCLNPLTGTCNHTIGTLAEFPEFLTA
jgi:hypothetical protein